MEASNQNSPALPRVAEFLDLDGNMHTHTHMHTHACIHMNTYLHTNVNVNSKESFVILEREEKEE